MNDDLKTWDKGAVEYLTVASEENDVFKKLIDTPQFLSLLGNIKNKKILDVGCGNGDFCKKLKENGAAYVVGLDGSENMINAAKQNYPSVQYVVCDLMFEDISFEPDYFDIVTAKMMLMNVGSLKILARKVYKVLKKEGIFAVDVVHPFRPLLKITDEENKRYAKSFNYFKETQSNISFANYTYAFYYRPVSQYINDFIDLGFVLKKIVEVGVDDEFVALHPEEKSKLNTPVSLHLLFKK